VGYLPKLQKNNFTKKGMRWMFIIILCLYGLMSSEIISDLDKEVNILRQENKEIESLKKRERHEYLEKHRLDSLLRNKYGWVDTQLISDELNLH
jgi:hypothetical protein